MKVERQRLAYQNVHITSQGVVEVPYQWMIWNHLPIKVCSISL